MTLKQTIKTIIIIFAIFGLLYLAKLIYDTYIMYGIASIIILAIIILVAIYCFYSRESQCSVRMPGRQRDQHRYFSTKQRQTILHRQRHRCKICGARLDHRSTQYDHKIPWSQGGRTNIRNGQALCANCHAKKCYEERSKK